MNNILYCSIAILASLFVKTNAQVCNADMVFMIDSSDNTASNNLFGSFNDALLLFAKKNNISNSGIRVGVVYYNNFQRESRLIQLTGNKQSLINQINSSQRLGGGVLHSVGLSAASELFTNGARQFSPRIAVLVTPSQSRFGVIPLNEIHQLQNNRGRNSMTVYALGVPLATNDFRFSEQELNEIATNNYITVMANNLLKRFDIIATACSNVVTTANICDKCEFREGVGYKSHSDCRKFIKCIPKPYDDNDFDVSVENCGDGLFWNQNFKTCVYFPESDCYRNECDSLVPYKFHSLSCGAYFVCSNKTVTHECCPRDKPAFNRLTKTCEFSTTCKFQCEENAAQPRNLECQKTNKPKVLSNGIIDRCNYVVIVGDTKFDMQCPAGTKFNSTDCSCTIVDSSPCPSDPILTPCSPDLDLEFASYQVMDRANNYPIDNFGPVSLVGNSARFTGSGRQRLAIVRYSNVDFGLPLAIRVKYRDEVNRANMTVLSTGGCISQPGVYINAGNGRVTIGIITEELGYTQPFESSINTQGANSWKDVTLWYDGKTLAGYVRDVSNSSERPFPPVSVSSTVKRIKMVEGSLQLGYSYNTGNPGFVGQIEMAKIWIGCKEITRPQDF